METKKVAYILGVPDLDLPPVPESASAAAKQCAEAIDAYLQLPLVVDKPNAFATHEERRAWRSSLPKETRAAYERNALRGNTIGAVLPRVELFLMQENGDAETKLKLKQSLQGIRRRYEELWLSNEGGSDDAVTQQKSDFVIKTLRDFLGEVRDVIVKSGS